MLVEDGIPKIQPQAGRNPEVDIVIQLISMENETINLIPIEAKVAIAKDNITQLATYMFRLSSAEELRSQAQVGFLISGNSLQLCILCCSHNSSLLPVVFVSPPFNWIAEDEVVTESLAIFMASIFLFKMSPIPLETVEPHILELAEENVNHQMEVKHPTLFHSSFSKLLTLVKEQDLKLKAQSNKLEEHARALEELATFSRQMNPDLLPQFGTPRKRSRLG